MDRNNRITIRINGKDKPIEERPKKEVPSKKETAAAKEEKEFRWVLPEEKSSPKKVVSLRERQKQHEQRKKKRGVQGAPKLPVHRKKKGHVPSIQKKKKPYALPKKQWLSAFSAVIVGLMMGFVVLTIFTDHHMKQQDTPKSESVATETSSGNSRPAAPMNLDLSLAVVQGGVFSSETSGEAAAENLKDGGFAAVLNQEQNKLHLFIGAGANKSNTEALAKLYKQQGQDVWVKKIQITADTDHLDKNVRTLLEDAKPLMKSLLTGSVSGLTSDQAAFTDSQWDKLNKQYQQLQSDSGKAAKPLKEALNNAMTHAGKYRSGRESSELWQVQQALLEAALSYQHLAQGKS